MKIFSSYYAHSEIPSTFIQVSISGGITEHIEKQVDIWDKRLAPSLDIFNEYKNSTLINKEEIYVKRFKNEILANRNLKEIVKSWTDKHGEDKNYVILCYEVPTDFCHRHIVAEAFENEFNIKVLELNVKKDYERVNYKFKRKKSEFNNLLF